MPRTEIQPFTDEHLGEAGRLLAERHRRHRAAERLLPARFEDPDEARAEVEAVWRGPSASGTAALGEGRLVGYLIGAPREDVVWGANVWVELAGHAVAEPEVVRDLYAGAAVRWVDEGRTRHYALVPATDGKLLEAWYRLSFGQQHALGIRDVPDEPWPEGVRKAEPRDIEAMVAQAPLIGQHQALSPVFSAGRPPDPIDELRDEIERDIDSREIANLVAEVDGRIVGNYVVVPVEHSGMHVGLGRPEHACFLGFAVTAPEVRGSGAGVALTKGAFAWAREAGYPTMVTDWRVTNLLSSRFWPARGFRISFLRLYRSIP